MFQAGLGTVITTTLPVTANITHIDPKHENSSITERSFIGVVGVDVFISQLNKLVLDFFANGDYVIITNNYGNVILHPNLHTDNVGEHSSNYLPTLLLPDLEHAQDDRNIEELARRMIDREQGNLTTKSLFLLKHMPKGEETLLQTTYFYGPIPDTPFAFAIASRHKLGFPDMEKERIREIFDNKGNLGSLRGFIIAMYNDGFLKLKSRYNCSILDFAQEHYYEKSELGDERRLFCDFEKADECEPNYCVKRHFQNMMYDLWRIYVPIVNQRGQCKDQHVNSCFVITGSGVYLSSKKNWLKHDDLESGQETLELKTKNEEFKDSILITRPRLTEGREGLHLNITKSVFSVVQTHEIFLATVGMEISLEALKEILAKHSTVRGQELDMMLVDENMMIISGFKVDSWKTDGHSVKSTYPDIAEMLVAEKIFFVFYYHECLNECQVEEPPDPSHFCNSETQQSRLELCCKQFATYSRNLYTLHVPTESVTMAANHSCMDSYTCARRCTTRYAIVDIPNTNALAIINLTPECAPAVAANHHEAHDWEVYNTDFCKMVNTDYYESTKRCFSLKEVPTEAEGCVRKATSSVGVIKPIFALHYYILGFFLSIGFMNPLMIV